MASRASLPAPALSDGASEPRLAWLADPPWGRTTLCCSLGVKLLRSRPRCPRLRWALLGPGPRGDPADPYAWSRPGTPVPDAHGGPAGAGARGGARPAAPRAAPGPRRRETWMSAGPRPPCPRRAVLAGPPCASPAAPFLGSPGPATLGFVCLETRPPSRHAGPGRR